MTEEREAGFHTDTPEENGRPKNTCRSTAIEGGRTGVHVDPRGKSMEGRPENTRKGILIHEKEAGFHVRQQDRGKTKEHLKDEYSVSGKFRRVRRKLDRVETHHPGTDMALEGSPTKLSLFGGS